jgi:hypothetical protein
MSYYHEDFDNNYISGRKRGHLLGVGAPHIPNKEEAKELRRLMQKSGETEEQVRGKIENRRLLAKAAKSPMQSNGAKRWKFLLKRRQKIVAQRLGLPGWHPDVQRELIQLNANLTARNRGWPL